MCTVKNTSPKILVLLLSLVVTLFLTLYVYLFLNESLFLFSLVTFIVLFTIYYFVLDRYVFSRLTELYQRAFSKNASFMVDITKAEQDVDQYVQKNSIELSKLNEKEALQKEFIGNIAHELKTPLFTMQGYILTLLEGGLEDSRINRKYLQKAEQSIERMAQLIEDLDFMTKLEAHQITLQFDPFDLKTLVDSCMEELQIYTSSERKLLNHVPKNSMVYADKKRIYQVFYNLLNNALKYSAERCLVEVSCTELDSKCVIEVKDNGAGIAIENLPRIFERFYRVEESRARQRGGSGLGLSIVKSIIDAHQETIHVRSQVGEGTVFTFTLSKG